MENPSIMSHVSVGVTDLERSGAFYDIVLATIGAKRMAEHPGAIAYGKIYPELWIHPPHDGGAPSVGNGSHFGFFGNSVAEVDTFYKTALDAGATCDGPPGPRELYGPQYYGCFLKDLDGNKIEASFWDESKE